MAQVYTGAVRVRHDEIDVSGRLHPAVYLRYLAQTAVEASAAAGYDGAWYAAAGTLWLVRRSTLDIHRPVTAGEQLAIRTWVEDFRRVRSRRRYEVRDDADRVCLEAVTDWVYVDTATGRPRRVPDEMAGGFGLDPAGGPERPAWSAPPPPAEPARSLHRVGYADIDSLGHMNNAAWVDVLMEATLDVLADRGWPLERLLAEGAAPLLVGVDVEYLAEARYRDDLETRTWFSRGEDLSVHQEVGRVGDMRPLVRASTRWRWVDGVRATIGPLPAPLAGALEALFAA